MTAPLHGVRILDLTSGVAGPWCTKLLADYGADVIKVERPGTGDPSRGHGRFPDGVPHREKSALFLWLNTSKRSVTLDVATPTGRALAAAPRRDSATPSSSTTGRLSWSACASRHDDFAAVNPRIVTTSVTAFGQSGPYAGLARDEPHVVRRRRPALPHRRRRPRAAAERRLPGGVPGRHVGLRRDARGALARARDRRRPAGRGRRHGGAGLDPRDLPAGLRLPEVGGADDRGAATSRPPPSASIPPLDGHIGIHAMPKNWPQLLDALDAQWMATDERFADNRARLRNDDELSAQFYLWTAGVTSGEAYDRAGAARAPISPVNTVADLLASAHLARALFFHEVDASRRRHDALPRPARPHVRHARGAPPRPPPRPAHDGSPRRTRPAAPRDLCALTAAGVV